VIPFVAMAKIFTDVHVNKYWTTYSNWDLFRIPESLKRKLAKGKGTVDDFPRSPTAPPSELTDVSSNSIERWMLNPWNCVDASAVYFHYWCILLWQSISTSNLLTVHNLKTYVRVSKAQRTSLLNSTKNDISKIPDTETYYLIVWRSLIIRFRAASQKPHSSQSLVVKATWRAIKHSLDSSWLLIAYTADFDRGISELRGTRKLGD